MISPARVKARRKGVTIIVTAMLLTIIVPLVGLAIDVGTLYSTRARIQSAADAAAMAASRNLAVGMTLADQVNNGKKRAAAYFKANFPEGSLETIIKDIDVTVTETALHTRVVKVAVNVEAPAFFMRYLGWGSGANGIKINVMGETTRRDVNIALVLDRSGSLESAGACDDVESSSLTFVKMFANGRDRFSLSTFGGSARVDYPSTKNFKDYPSLLEELDKLYPGGCAGYTGSAQGLWLGYQQLVANAEPGALNVLVFFTDGRPNTLTANWPVKTNVVGSPSRCYDWTNGVPYGAGGWDPINQRYLGFVAGGSYGIKSHLAAPMPTGDNDQLVSVPVGYKGPSPVAPASDCYYLQGGWDDAPKDVAYIPDTDAYGSSVFGWKNVDTHAAGHPYAGKAIFGDWTNGENAAINAVDNAAVRIRARELNTAVDVLVYTIGLGDVGDEQHELLRRIANDKAASSFNSSAPTGRYIYAPTATELADAFSTIASEVLRFSK